MGEEILKYDLPEGTNYCFGSTVDKLNQKIFWFNENSNGDNGIYEYDIATSKVKKIYSYKGKNPPHSNHQ